ncbi:hypothetical protein F4809DRAFT_586971 [Biscogniauxia mediterranea]|nr:hypothetical protein F4809DRAFT_586971 [Biscogniauxia mediterranea]
MDTVPVEIINMIVSYLPKAGLAPFATISSTWRDAVERRVFEHLTITSKHEDLQDLARFVTPTGRRAYLRTLTFYVFVPDGINDGSEDSDDSDAEGRARPANDIIPSEVLFNDGVRRLFDILADYDTGSDGGGGGDRGINLELGWMLDSDDGDYESNADPRWRLQLADQGRQLPVVRCVTGLFFSADFVSGRVAPRMAVDLAARLPSLQRIVLAADKGMGMPTYDRFGLACALAAADHLAQLRGCAATLLLDGQNPCGLGIDSFPVLPSYEDSSFDPLGAAVRTWSHNLVSLSIRGVFDGSLFWPHENDLEARMPDSPWPRLKNLNVSLRLTTPDGEWYFTGRPGGRLRNVPCENTLQPLFESWAKGLECMPVLEQATIAFRIKFKVPGSRAGVRKDWSVAFVAPGVAPGFLRDHWRTDLERKYACSPKLFFTNLGGWRPSGPTMDKLYALVKDRFPGTRMAEFEVDLDKNVTKL